LAKRERSGFWVIGIGLGALLLAAGCKSGNDSGVNGVSASNADKLNSQHSAFEKSGDPPLSADTYFASGQLRETQGDLGVALQQYQAALKVNPNHKGALFRTAVVYTELKQFPRAIETWQQYVKADNFSADAYSNLGFCYETSGDTLEAKLAYQKGIGRDPKSQPCRVNYGLLLARQGWIIEATDQLAVVLEPADVHYNLGSVFQQQGKMEFARKEFRRALELNPNLADAQKRLASIQ
jgi:tetratricopeptide (TPR) repeat protein